MRAGADFLLSLNEDTLDLAFETDAVPVLIPARHGELDGLSQACERPLRAGRPFLADPILDPIHFGFTTSIVRYHESRRRLPEAELLMGVGNLTELTDADTTGITMTLMGMVSELAIRNILVVQVSPHCRRAVAEAELARRIMFAAKADGSLPQGYDPGLMALRDRRPVLNSPAEIDAMAIEIGDANWRIEVAQDGIHAYNRDGHHVAGDPFDLFPRLAVEQDGSHAFYLGVELARAQVAHQLGKRYVQDNELRWGVAAPRPPRIGCTSSRPAARAGCAPEGPPGGELMPFIRESIVTTLNADGSAHVAPLGVIVEEPFLVIAPFHPSTTLDNLQAPRLRLRELHHRRAGVRGLRDATAAGLAGGGGRAHLGLAPGGALAHSEVEVAEVVEDELRPRFRCRTVHEVATRLSWGSIAPRRRCWRGRSWSRACTCCRPRRSRASCAIEDRDRQDRGRGRTRRRGAG